MEQMTTICDMVGQYMQKKEEEKRIAEEQAAKDRYWKIPICYDDDEDDTFTITPDSPKMDSLIMENEHLDTIPETKSDEFIKSSVEDLVQNPRESENECECDLPLRDDSPESNFTNVSNPLFDANDDGTSSNEEDFKISSNPLFDLDEVSPIDEEVLENTNSIPP
ncbi:hypothetical protein Tco_1222322, partial [Tanacetum coccineum]